jgi:hypothetical protein
MSMGVLMTLTSDPKPQGMSDDEHMKMIENAIEEATKERINYLTHKLLIRIEPLVQGEDISDAIRDDVLVKLEAPGGGTLLDIIGYIYQSEAKKKLKSFLGLGKLAASLREKGHNISQTWKMAKAAVSVSATSSRLEDLQGVEGPEAEAERAALEEKLTQVGMSAMWRLGEIEIENITRQVCSAVLYDSNVTSETRQKRASAIEKIGHIYKKLAKKFVKSGSAVMAEFAAALDEDSGSGRPEASSSTTGTTTLSNTTEASSSSSASSAKPVVARKTPSPLLIESKESDAPVRTVASDSTKSSNQASESGKEKKKSSKKKEGGEKSSENSPRTMEQVSPRSNQVVAPRPTHMPQNSLSETVVSEVQPDTHQTLSDSADGSASVDHSSAVPIVLLPPPDHPIKLDDTLSVSMSTSTSAAQAPNVRV